MSTPGYPVALVTGASRGVGASVAKILAGRGSSIVVNYHSKRARAEEVASAVRALGQRALLAQADLTSRSEVAAMMDSTRLEFGRLDTLILNASGGLEKGKPADYAMQLNLNAQIQVVDGLELVKWLPAAQGQEGTLLGFGKHDRGALHGRYLVMRQWLDGHSVEMELPGSEPRLAQTGASRE